MLGEIVEHEIEAPNPPQMTTKSGFPDLNKLKEKRVSRWKQRQESKKSSRRTTSKADSQ